MTNLHELNSLTASIGNLDKQIKSLDRKPIKTDILATYAKGIAIIDDCRSFISKNLAFFLGTPLCKSYDHHDTHTQHWFCGGLNFIVNNKTKKVVRCWMMNKYEGTKDEQGYYDYRPIPFFEWYSYDLFDSVTLENQIEIANDKKLLEIKASVDGFHRDAETLYGLIADALTKTKEYKERYLANLNNALDNGVNKKEVIYKIEITKETKK